MKYIKDEKVKKISNKEPRDHQILCVNEVTEALKTADRGKIIMACGTGKTYTSLLIAEKIAGPGKKVLYMVPSLSLMSQTIREWKNDCSSDFVAFSACSDKKIGKRKTSDDVIDINLSDLSHPATTDPKKLSYEVSEKSNNDKMTVVFSTYQSIEVIHKAQYEFGMDEFDLIICDEAHRTTGETL